MKNYVVVDLEMCDVVKGLRGDDYSCGTEIIQIGAVLMDKEYNIVDKFVINVRPEFGWISGNIEQLTDIHADELYNAPYLKEALDKFSEWLPDEDLVMVEWSKADEKQLRIEMAEKGIQNEKVMCLIEHYIDCQKLFSEKINDKKQYNLSNALISVDIAQEGRAHNGLDDAYNTALLFAKLKRENKITLNPILEKARSGEIYHLNFSMKGLFSGIDLSSLPV